MPEDTRSLKDITLFNSSYHSPVMWREVLDIFPDNSYVLVDGTLGGGGHSAALLHSSAKIRVLGLDRDERAIEFAEDRLRSFGSRKFIIKSAFSQLSELISRTEVIEWVGASQLKGGLFDLGVSSRQLDDVDRGFSFRATASIDMRMDLSDSEDALAFLKRAPLEELIRIFAENGERQFARFLAKRIKDAVSMNQIKSASELRNLVASVLPKRYTSGKIDPATKIFQAIRISVNNEMGELEALLRDAPSIFKVGARICIISYHSGEDMRVKSAFTAWTKGNCECPVVLDCVCGAQVTAKSLVRLAKPTEEETRVNPRARSARLRAIEFIEPISVASLRGRVK